MVAVGTSRAAAPAASRPISTSKTLTPVRLPTGRFRLATSPNATGSNPIRRRLGSSRLLPLPPCRRGHSRRSRPPDGEPDRPPTPLVDRIGPPPSGIRSRRSDPRHSRLLQALVERGQRCVLAERPAVEEPDHRHRSLRTRHERPRRRAADHGDEFAPPHVPSNRGAKPTILSGSRNRVVQHSKIGWSGSGSGQQHPLTAHVHTKSPLIRSPRLRAFASKSAPRCQAPWQLSC